MADDGGTHIVAYVVLEYVGIALLLFLFGHCLYRSINYILQVICIVAILNNINESVLVLHYGHRVMSEAGGTAGCVVSAVFEHFIPLSLTLLATCVGVNVWLMIVRSTKYVELQLIPWYCLVAFGVPLVTTAIAIILMRDQPHLSAYPRRYYCSLAENNVTLGTFTVPMLIGALIGIAFTLHTVVYLVRHYVRTRRSTSSASSFQRNIVLELSHCIRLIIFSLAFGIIVLMAVMQRIVETADHKDTSYGQSESLDMSSDFSGSIVAYVLFVIFGTTRDSLRSMSFLVCPWRFRTRRVGGLGRQQPRVQQQQQQQQQHSDLEMSLGVTPVSSSSNIQLSFEEMLRDENTRGTSR
ncbi:hypothetical protein B0O80DRAFT_437215 [Mortierella sp. GBAus27b]|nr:hypothetical protein B0O80DRAFT_437215 [Mortierella sp. GBAus27b]